MNDGPSGMLVVGVDGSAPAQQGLTLAVSFAIQNRIGVHSVAVGAPMPASPFLSFPSPPGEVEEHLGPEAERDA